jgi:hypothetical protein
MDLGQSAAAFKRARWLADLAAAILVAEEAANRLVAAGRHVSETQALLDQLRSVKGEVEALRLGGWRAPVQEIGSKWIKFGDN